MRKGMETERVTAEDKGVGAENEEAPPQSRRMRRRRRQHPDVANPAVAEIARPTPDGGSGGDAAMGAATHGEADATSSGHLLPAPWYACDVNMTPWVRQWAPYLASSDHKRLPA